MLRSLRAVDCALSVPLPPLVPRPSSSGTATRAVVGMARSDVDGVPRADLGAAPPPSLPPPPPSLVALDRSSTNRTCDELKDADEAAVAGVSPTSLAVESVSAAVRRALACAAFTQPRRAPADALEARCPWMRATGCGPSAAANSAAAAAFASEHVNVATLYLIYTWFTPGLHLINTCQR